MTNENPEPQPPADPPEHIHPSARKIAKSLNSVWYVLSSFLAVLALINALIPQLLGNFGIIRDFFDAPTASRQNAAVASRPASEEPRTNSLQAAIASGYVYYETTNAGDLTSDGRLSVFGQQNRPAFAQLRPGNILQAQDGLRLRAESTSNSQLLGVIGALECLRVVEGEPRSVPTSAGTTGGWVPVTRIPCP